MEIGNSTGVSRLTAATIIIGQKVHSGSEQAFEEWQKDLNREASKYPGFLGAEINPPTTVQPEWVVVYRFDSVPHVMAWLNSATRQERLAAGQQYFDGPGTQQILGGGAQNPDPLVTVAVSHRVAPDDVGEFLAWQDRLRLAESRFPGFRGSELFRPVAGLQEEWTALYRYDSAADLDRWLVSDERKHLLAEGAKFADFHSRTIDNSFGSWFAFADGNQESPPSPTKTSIAVWVGLYPTVVLLSLLFWPLKMPLWLNLLVGNLCSSFVMTFVTMPYYVNPLLKRWLRPPPNVPAAKNNWRGIGIVAAALAFWVMVFYLVTRVFWHLP
ncbi:antibiotic biosynthesis monooxygenase [Mycobacterium sp. 1274761.0]|uniref:antibiotic biosynthesis monooxygenase n=1 Tax=Mycobacterium sp. 1274761.0 TaxID=1834077 RepID=UPI0007FFD407|nr:antibiotic biosynthesis monooxygenase [Mycobacterium sp. 1274761.0]OBK70632.1 antibiotic biosynthesis monooxygenase [Mycobacterium sp. 1274761.0]